MLIDRMLPARSGWRLCVSEKPLQRVAELFSASLGILLIYGMIRAFIGSPPEALTGPVAHQPQGQSHPLQP